MSRNRSNCRPAMLPRVLVAALASIAAASVAAAAEDPLPTADAVLEKLVEATGGRAAYESVGNSVTEGTMELVAQGITLNLTVYVARPDLAYSLTESAAIGTIEKGTDGNVVWEKSVMAGPRILEGREREDFLRETTFDKFLRWRDYYEKGEVTGTEDVAGRPCYTLVLTPKGGKPQTLYVDRESGLVSKIAMTLDTQMGSVPFETTLEDYRDAGGVKAAFKARTRVVGQERVLTVTSIRRNVDLPPDRFRLPAEIEELLAKKNAPPAPAAAPEPAKP